MSDPVNPKHHKDFVEGLQWAEAYACELGLAGESPAAIARVVASWADKYFDRCGRKDPAVQELAKGLWYLRYAWGLAHGHSTVAASVSALGRVLSNGSEYRVALKRIQRPIMREGNTEVIASCVAVQYLLRTRERYYVDEMLIVAITLLQLTNKPTTLANARQLILRGL